MTLDDFKRILERTVTRLDLEAKNGLIRSSKHFEQRVRAVVDEELQASNSALRVDFDSSDQAFPDICLGNFGIEVKYTEKDTWRGVANSVSQGQKDHGVTHIFVIWGKMGGNPQVRFRLYEEVVFHVRTSHVPRFEIDMEAAESWFDLFKLSYSDFSNLEIEQKIDYVRRYARIRLRNGMRRFFWFLEKQNVDQGDDSSIRLFDNLDPSVQLELAIEELVLFPSILNDKKTRREFDTRVTYFLSRKNVLYPQSHVLITKVTQPFHAFDDLQEFLEIHQSLIVSVFERIDINCLRLFWDWWDGNTTDLYRAWLDQVSMEARER